MAEEGNWGAGGMEMRGFGVKYLKFGSISVLFVENGGRLIY